MLHGGGLGAQEELEQYRQIIAALQQQLSSGIPAQLQASSACIVYTCAHVCARALVRVSMHWLPGPSAVAAETL